MTSKLVRAACPHDCPDTCAMLVTVEDGRAVKVHGNPWSFANVKSLRGNDGEPVLEIATVDASARGIVSGQAVRIFNDRGSIECKAVVGDRARPGVVNGMGLWWKKLSRHGRNVNELTHQRLTDIGRAPTFYACLVQVEAVPASRPAA